MGRIELLLSKCEGNALTTSLPSIYKKLPKTSLDKQISHNTMVLSLNHRKTDFWGGPVGRIGINI